MKSIPKGNLHVMIPFDRHPHTNTMVGRGTATGRLQEHSLSELMFSVCRFWVHCSSGCYTFRVCVRCKHPRGKLTLWSIINYKLCQTYHFLGGAKPAVGHDLLIHEVSRSHTQRCTTVGRTPLDESLACRRGLFTTHSHPRPRWYSNPQSQLASGRTTTS